jgi:uncharacterized protein (TIGR02594 family)
MTPWMTIAQSLMGEKELKGRENPKIVEMYRICNASWAKEDEVPWCAAFVGACLELAGYVSSNSLAAVSYLNFGKQLAVPTKGCIVVLKPMKAEQAGTGHVAFFDKIENGRVYLLGGNQSDSVKISSYPIGLVRAYRYPDKVAPLPTGLKYLKTITQIT